MLTRGTSRLLVAALFVAAAWYAFAGRGGSAGNPVVLVSGRDDHGLLAEPYVSLLAEPEGAPVGAVADGGLVEVIGERSEWLRVRTLEGDEDLEGWINDHHLRRRAHVVHPVHPACGTPLAGEPGGPPFDALRASEQVVLLDRHTVDGQVWLGVRTVQHPRVGVIPRAWARELPGPVPAPDVSCGTIEVDRNAAPHAH